LADHGMFFWDYGNAFLLEAQRAGADVKKRGAGKGEFRYPSYVQHIMGDIFSLGFGPFRWVCTSGNPEDLATTDFLATAVLQEAVLQGGKASHCLMWKVSDGTWVTAGHCAVLCRSQAPNGFPLWVSSAQIPQTGTPSVWGNFI
ncbi:Urocanate hydratase, partial [Varanus komodoensis]